MKRTVQWLNNNRYRRYPFKEDIVLLYNVRNFLDKSFILPDNLILDFQCVLYKGTLRSVALTSIVYETLNNQKTLTLVFSDTLGFMSAEVLIPENAEPYFTPSVYNTNYTLKCVIGEGLEDVINFLSSFNAAKVILDISVDTHEFQQIEPSLVGIQDKHRIVSLNGDTVESIPISGDVYWENGYGTEVFFELTSNTIFIKSGPGSGAGFGCSRRYPNLPDCKGQLLSINGLYANGSGNIDLGSNGGLEVIPEPNNNRIVFKSKPPTDLNCGK